MTKHSTAAKIVFLAHSLPDPHHDTQAAVFHELIERNFVDICSDKASRRTFSVLDPHTHGMFCVTEYDAAGCIATRRIYSPLENQTATLLYNNNQPEKIAFEYQQPMNGAERATVKEFGNLWAEIQFFQNNLAVYVNPFPSKPL